MQSTSASCGCETRKRLRTESKGCCPRSRHIARWSPTALHLHAQLASYPARTRTWNSRTKTCCVADYTTGYRMRGRSLVDRAAGTQAVPGRFMRREFRGVRGSESELRLARVSHVFRDARQRHFGKRDLRLPAVGERVGDDRLL